MSEWVTLTDVTSGSELFNGSSIYCYVNSIKFGGGNNIGDSPVQGVGTEIDSTLDGTTDESLGSMYDRRIGYNTYASFNSPLITLNGGWTEEIGSLTSVGSILTPFKLWRMIHTDHQFKLKGGITIPNLITGESGSGFFDANGIPVVFVSPWTINENYKDATNAIKWATTLRIDRKGE